MRRNRFRPGDDAVSPVVGVVLLVGIAVLLTTSVGVFVLGFGPGESPPETEMQMYQEDGNVTITVVRPAGLERQNIEIRANGTAACVDASSEWLDSNSLDRADTATVYGPDTASCSTGTPLPTGTNIRVVWESPGGGRSEIVAEHEVI